MIAGVDGCRGGWIVAIRNDRNTSPPAIAFVPTFTEVLRRTASCAAVCIDMPIGIPDSSPVRICDAQARNLLSAMAPAEIRGTASRVFNVPPRAVLYADTHDYAAFNALHKNITGKGVSRQAYAITPKIKEVDACMTPELQKRIVEAHPELCFAHMHGSTLPSKHGNHGIRTRAELLFGSMDNFLVYHKRIGLPQSKCDDVLDACVLLYAAEHFADCHSPLKDNTRRLPAGAIPLDSKALRQEIRF